MIESGKRFSSFAVAVTTVALSTCAHTTEIRNILNNFEFMASQTLRSDNSSKTDVTSGRRLILITFYEYIRTEPILL